jgi:hypothetical protein
VAEALTRAEAAEAELQGARVELTNLKERFAKLSDETDALRLARASAEAREAVAADALREVQAENDRLASAGRWRDEGLATRQAELTARTDAAEAQATELAAAVNAATNPLLRQLAQLRSQQEQLSDQARATETALQAQLASAALSAAHAAKEAATRLDEAKLAVRRGQEREAALGIQLEDTEEARARDGAV